MPVPRLLSVVPRLFICLLVAVLVWGDMPWVVGSSTVASAAEKGGAQQKSGARHKEHKRETQKARKQRKQAKSREARNEHEAEKSSKPQDVIVVLKRGGSPEQIAEEVGADPTQVYDHVLNGFAAEVSPAELAELETLPEVAAIVPDYPVEAFATVHDAVDRVSADAHNAPSKCKKIDDKTKRKKCFKKAMKDEDQAPPPPPPPPASETVAPPASNQPGQLLPTGIDRIDAEAQSLAGFAQVSGAMDVDVAVLDTGIAAHPDLNVVGGISCLPNNTSSTDDNGHGTHVAGTIAALDNAIGVVGVAPQARLWAVKVLDAQGDGNWSSVICGLDWVQAHSDTVDVVNMSLGGGGSDSVCPGEDPLHNAVCRVVNAGIPVVVAAGNAHQDAVGVVPAAYDEVITVSAFADFDGVPGGLGASSCGSNGRDDTFASFSNYGSDVDIAAPGVCIRSTSPGSGYAVMSGTSMAAPHVTGAVARYLAGRPAATPDDVRNWLRNTAARLQDSAGGFTGDRDTSPEPVLYLGGD